MSCDGIYAKVEDLERMWWFLPSGTVPARFNEILKNGGTEISATLSSVGACACSWADWVDEFLKYINLLIAGALLDAPVNRLSKEQRSMFRKTADSLLMKILSGDLELCAGATGKQVPAWGVAEYIMTPMGANQAIAKALMFEGNLDELITLL